MPTNLALDDRLIAEAVRVGGHRTKKAAVTAALEEYVQRRRRLAVLDLAGKIDFHPDFDPKKLRWRKAR
jgi:Arc/MetJ family transcription regulator